MEFMKTVPDKFYDLAIVDPEYGKDAANMTMGKGKNKKWTKKDWDKNPQMKPILMNFLELVNAKLFGAEITLIYQKQVGGYFGTRMM